jgi:uncharacterized membrane protein YhaH (DUF805 family)
MRPVQIDDFLRFFFTVGGRISRREYALGLVFIYAVNAALLSFALHQDDHYLALGLTIMISALPSTLALFALAAKRCHDLALSGAMTLLLLVPVVGLLWLVGLGFVAGDSDPNLYGPPPRFDPN